MTEETKEAISSLVDDELQDVARTRLLDRLLSDTELRVAWERYHLVRDCMHDATPAHGAQSLAERVKRQIALEPVVLAERRARRRTSFVRPAAGAAIAASVAVLAVLAVQSLSTSGDTRAPGQPAEVAGLRWDTPAPAVERRLNTYLVNHSEYQGNGMHGMLPYARIVGYDAQK
jgi:sigma-E factor negative regulatory protein RseA